MFDTWTEYRLSRKDQALLFLSFNSHRVQLTAEASLISFVCVIAVFIRIAVRLTLFRVFVLVNKIKCQTVECTMVLEDRSQG